MATIDTSSPYLDFEVFENSNCKTLLIGDVSNYAHLELEDAWVEITLPGYPDPLKLRWSKHTLNVFNSNSFGFGQALDSDDLVNLPDGVYKICLKNCVSELDNCKYHLRMCSLLCAFREQLITLDLACNTCFSDQKKKSIQQIDLLMKAAEAHAELCNPLRAMEFYKKAKEMLDDLGSCCK